MLYKSMCSFSQTADKTYLLSCALSLLRQRNKWRRFTLGVSALIPCHLQTIGYY